MSLLLGPCLGPSGFKAIRFFGPATRRDTIRQLTSVAYRLNNGRTTSTYQQISCPPSITSTTSHAIRQPLKHLQRRNGGIRTLFSERVLTNYVQLPPSYRDDVGLPFSSKDLTGEEVVAIFGSSLSTDRASTLLRILHGRRVAGTLDDPAYYDNTKGYLEHNIKKGLAYLRKTVPVDELINAGLRAEEELALLEEEEADGAGENQPRPKGTPPPSTGAEKWTRRLFKEQPVDDPYGKGAFDRIRATREAQWEVEVKRREEERKLKEAEEAQNGGGLAKIDKNAPRQLSPKMQARIKAATSDLKEPPQMSHVERLWSTYAIVIAALVGGSIYGNYIYEPPTSDERMWPWMPEAMATAIAVVAAATVVFCWWRIPALWPFLNRYFILTSATPKGIAVFGAIMSHQTFSHLLLNTVPVFFLIQALDYEVGRSGALQTLAAGGSIGFLASLTHMVVKGRLHMSTLGISGACYAVGAAYFYIHKFEGFKVLGFPPDPYNGIQGLGFIGLAIGGHIVALMGKGISRTDLVSHMAGMTVGIIYGEWFCMRKRERAAAYREERQERALWQLLIERVTGGAKSPVEK